MITVWTKPQCSQCNIVKSILDKEGVEYQVKDIFMADGEFNPVAKKLMDDHGIKSAPIVESLNIVFGGYNKSMLDEVIDWEKVWE